jgi:hypothetical protein
MWFSKAVKQNELCLVKKLPRTPNQAYHFPRPKGDQSPLPERGRLLVNQIGSLAGTPRICQLERSTKNQAKPYFLLIMTREGCMIQNCSRLGHYAVHLQVPSCLSTDMTFISSFPRSFSSCLMEIGSTTQHPDPLTINFTDQSVTATDGQPFWST